MTSMRSDNSATTIAAVEMDTVTRQASGRVARALQIHRNVVACNEHIARGSGVHELTAALMLPCYRAEFCRLVLALTSAEERELRHALDAH